LSSNGQGVAKKNGSNSRLTRNAPLLSLVIIFLTAIGIAVGVYTCHSSTSESQRAETRGMVAAFKEDLQATYENLLANQTENQNFDDLLAYYNKAKDRYEAANRALDSLDYVEARNDINDGVTYLKYIRTYYSSTLSRNIRIIATPGYLSVDIDFGNATGITKEGEPVTEVDVSWGFFTIPMFCPDNIAASYSVYPEAIFDRPITVTFNYAIPERLIGKKLILVTREENSDRWTIINSQVSGDSVTFTVDRLNRDYVILLPIPSYPWCLFYPALSSCPCR
jgi:hypothetical protein